MHRFIIFLITCLLFASVANSAMLCCISMEMENVSTEVQTQASHQQMSMADCNKTMADAESPVDSELMSSMDMNAFDCHCDACFQLPIGQIFFFDTLPVSAAAIISSPEILPLTIPNPLYAPPKLRS